MAVAVFTFACAQLELSLNPRATQNQLEQLVRRLPHSEPQRAGLRLRACTSLPVTKFAPTSAHTLIDFNLQQKELK